MKPLALFGALVLAACTSMDGFLYNPKKVDIYEFDPSLPQPAERDVELVAEDGTLTYGALLRSAERPPLAMMLYCHGNNAHLAYRDHWARVARLAGLGFDVFVFDYRGYGRSEGRPSEAGIRQDALAARAAALARATDPSRLVYYGMSLGTAVCTALAASEHPKALALEAAFASVDDFVRDNSTLDLPVGYLANDRWDTRHNVAAIEAPVLVMHGAEDDFVRPEFGVAVYEGAHDPKELWIVEGAQHGNVPDVAGDEYRERVRSFFDRSLR